MTTNLDVLIIDLFKMVVKDFDYLEKNRLKSVNRALKSKIDILLAPWQENQARLVSLKESFKDKIRFSVLQKSSGLNLIIWQSLEANVLHLREFACTQLTSLPNPYTISGLTFLNTKLEMPPLFGEEEWIAFSKSFPNLSVISVRGVNFTSEGLIAILKNFRNLKQITLDFDTCNIEVMKALLKHLSLETLSISGNLDQSTIKYFFDESYKLKKLKQFLLCLRPNCISFETLTNFLSTAGQLTHFTLMSFPITNESLFEILGYLPHLKELTLGNCSKLTLEGIKLFMESSNSNPPKLILNAGSTGLQLKKDDLKKYPTVELKTSLST